MTTWQTGLSGPDPAAAGHAGTATLVLAARTNPETARALAALAGHEDEIGEGLFYSNGSGSETPLLVTATALAERDEATPVVNEGLHLVLAALIDAHGLDAVETMFAHRAEVAATQPAS